MKVKKVLNSRKRMDYFSEKSDNSKNEVNDGMASVLTTRIERSTDSIDDNDMPSGSSTSAAQSPHMDHMNGIEEQLDPTERRKPILKPIPQFIPNTKPSIVTTLPPMPSLKAIPIFDYYFEQNDSFFEPLQSSTDQILKDNNCVDNKIKDNNSIEENPSLDMRLLSELTKYLTENLVTVDTSATVDSPSLVPNGSHIPNESNHSNECSLKTTINTNTECLQNVNINEREVLNTSNNLLAIDLSDNSNSPKNITTCASNSSPLQSPTKVSTNVNRFVTLNTSSIKSNHLLNTNESNVSQMNGISNNKPNKSRKAIKTIVPMRYCAKNYRIFNMTRHSGRLKATTQEEDYDYDQMANASWSQLDGSQYECVVSKWVDDQPMSEDLRKEILRKVEEMHFAKSLLDSDSGVFYCFTAFEGQSNRTDGLKCVMRLDTNAVKQQRFSGSVITRMFLLSGQSVVTTENGKQRKNVETGHEVYIPAHTRYSVENKAIESSYFYIIITRYVE